jgi:hypothetical protein
MDILLRNRDARLSNNMLPGGPSESQKFYGSDLPPSLRWGSARRYYLADDEWDYHPRRLGTGQYNRQGYNTNVDPNVYRRQYNSQNDYRTRPTAHSPAPIINVYNDVYQDQDADLRATPRPSPRVHVPSYPTVLPGAYPAPAPRMAKHASRRLDRADRMSSISAEGLVKMRLGQRMAMRSSGRDHFAEVGSSETEELARMNLEDEQLSVVLGAEESEENSDGDHIEQHQHDSDSEVRSSHRRRSPRRMSDLWSNSQGRSPRQSRSNRPRSDFSGHSNSTFILRTSPPWFLKKWSVEPRNPFVVRDAGFEKKPPASSKFVTELYYDLLQRSEAAPAAPAAPSPFQRVRCWRYNPVLPTTGLNLKRVVHATYGDLLQDEAHKSPSPPGFIAVPQSCSSQGATLYHIL